MGLLTLVFEIPRIEVGKPQNSEKIPQKLGFEVGSPNFGA